MSDPDCSLIEKIPVRFRGCPDHQGAIVWIEERSHVSYRGELWEWRAPRFRLRFACCSDRTFRVALRQVLNPDHTSHGSRHAPMDPGIDEMHLLDARDRSIRRHP